MPQSIESGGILKKFVGWTLLVQLRMVDFMNYLVIDSASLSTDLKRAYYPTYYTEALP